MSMDASAFDKELVGLVKKAVNGGVEPCTLIGILESMKLDVYQHMKRAQSPVSGAKVPSVLTHDQIDKLRQQRGN